MPSSCRGPALMAYDHGPVVCARVRQVTAAESKRRCHRTRSRRYHLPWRKQPRAVCAHESMLR